MCAARSIVTMPLRGLTVNFGRLQWLAMQRWVHLYNQFQTLIFWHQFSSSRRAARFAGFRCTAHNVFGSDIQLTAV